MPTRYLKPGIRDSGHIEALSLHPDAEILYYRLLVTVDDFGRFDGRGDMIKAYCFPVRLRATADKCMQWLDKLQEAGLILLYSIDNKPYLQITKWVNKARSQLSKYPCPPTNVYNPLTVLPGTGTGTGTIKPEPKPMEGHGEPKKNGHTFLLPADIDLQLWHDFIEMRQRIKKPATDRAKWLIIGKLANLEQEGHNPKHVLQQSIRNGWQDVFPLRKDK